MVSKAVKESELEQANWHWRNSMRTVRFFNMDARASMPFILLLVYARPVTLFLAVVTTMAFRFLEMKGLTFPAAMRSLRVWLIGQHRPSWANYRRRTMRDYGQ